MQVTRRQRTLVLALAALAAGSSRASAEDIADPRTAEGLVRVFADSKHVLVRSLVQDAAVPLGKDLDLSMHWNNEKVTIPAIQAPPGSAEAVDAITTASRPIEGNAFHDFVKVRNEFEGQLTRGAASLAYYHSIESDYLAHQLAADWNRDFRDQQFNLAVGSSYGWDAIDPLPNDRTVAAKDHKNTLHWNVTGTQVLTPKTLLRVGLEYNHVEGLQHNPYRRVYAGGTTVAERHPETRERRDAFVKLSQYLPNQSSLKFDYRFYDDDWGVLSHETTARLSQYITPGLYVQYEYRWYTQTAASFWRPEYLTTNGVDGFQTGDYRLGPLSSHLFGGSLHFDLGVLAADSPTLRRFGVALDYERYFNSNNYSADILETGVEFRF